jgi:hypothetical protein
MRKILTKLWLAVSKDPRTSVAGIVGFVASMLSYKGILIPEGLQVQIISATALVIGLLASDGNSQNGKGE